MSKNLISIVIILLFNSMSAHAGIWDQLTPGPQAKVIEVVDGDTLVLENGKSIRLLGIQAPEISHKLTRLSDPHGMQAKQDLITLTLNKNIRLYYDTNKTDRYGRTLAHLRLQDGKWAQAELLKNGAARVYTFPDNRKLISEMLSHETTGRKNGKGLWQLPHYQIKQADKTKTITANQYHLVEGTIDNVTPTKRFVYINFDKDWKTDFTIAVKPILFKTFPQPKFSINNLKGKKIRVRGWAHYKNGPLIKITHPEQIEFIQ